MDEKMKKLLLFLLKELFAQDWPDEHTDNKRFKQWCEAYGLLEELEEE